MLVLLAEVAGRCGRQHLKSGASRRGLAIAEEVLRNEPNNLEIGLLRCGVPVVSRQIVAVHLVWPATGGIYCRGDG